MVLLVADPGPLRAAVEAGLRQAGEDVALRSPNDEDLWLAARGRRAVVYLPGSSLLEASLAPSPSAERVAEVLAAAGAPGVQVLVPVFPDHPSFDLELDVVRRHGRPYAALRSPPLLEEIATLLPDDRRALWLPRLGHTRATTASTLVTAIREALDTEWQGRVTPVAAEALDAVELVKRAAEIVGRPLPVRPLRPWLFRLLRGVGRWLRRREVALLAALAPLLPELAPPSRRRALPPAHAPG